LCGPGAPFPCLSHPRACPAPQAAKLGPDPLREDADVEALWAKVTRCTKPIGLVLMDQTMMAGARPGWRRGMCWWCLWLA